MLSGNEHRRFARDKMCLLVVKTASKSELGKVRSGVLENGRGIDNGARPRGADNDDQLFVGRFRPEMARLKAPCIPDRSLYRSCKSDENSLLCVSSSIPVGAKSMYCSANREIDFSGRGRIKACDGSPESL